VDHKAHDNGKNGKSHATPEQTKEAISAQEKVCAVAFGEYFVKMDKKLDKITETLGYVNTLLSERLSNHAVRIGSLETALAKSRNEE